MKIKFQKEVTKITLIATVVPAAILALSVFSDNQNVYALQSEGSIDITNNLENDNLYFNKVENRQDVQIKSDPPEEVKALQSGGFKIEKGDSEKSYHLKLQYYVGETGSDETVTFGFKGDTWGSVSCFTETPDNIEGSHENCDQANKKFFFKEK